jgi:cytochrome c556
MRIHLVAAAAVVSVAAASVAFAALPKDKALAIMHERHEGMEKIGDTNKLLRREFASSAPFAPAVKSGAATIAGLAKQASGWFPPGTGPEMGNTGAKAAIWQNQKDFQGKLVAFQQAAAAFNAAAASGNMDSAKARYIAMIDTCDACHKSYRSEMHH